MSFYLRTASRLPKKMLITRTDRMGDFILSLPTFEAAKQIGIPSISVLCRDFLTPLLENMPHIDQIISIPDEFDSEEHPAQFAKEIIAQNFDAILVLVNDPIIKKILPHLKKHIPIRVGPLSKPSGFKFFNYPVVQKRSHCKRNEAAYNLQLLRVFQRKPNYSIKPKICFSAIEISTFRQVAERLQLQEVNWKQTVAIHSGMSGSALNWPLEHYKQLVEMILQEGGNVILTGSGKEEQERNQSLIPKEDGYTEKVHDLTGRIQLRELAMLFSKVKAVVAPSTGPLHLANAVNATTIGIYPPVRVQSRARWAPYLHQGVIFSPDVNCKEKYHCKKEKCVHHPCMDSITPKAIFSLLQKLLPLAPQE